MIYKPALDLIKNNDVIKARLMLAFKRGNRAIEKWIKNNDVRLTTVAALAIIREETGLTDDEILTTEPASNY